MKEKIAKFFDSEAYGVIGASNQRHKFGNKVLRCLMQANKLVYPVNPHDEVIEGLNVVKDVQSLPDTVLSISIITPPKITEKIVEQAASKRIQNIWMQPGAENLRALELCKRHGINVIAGGPCILIELGFRDD